MLTKKEQQWVKRLQKTLDSCPESLRDKAQCYTIGDPSITICNKNMYIATGTEVCIGVDNCGAELATVRFPFQVWATAG